MNNLENYNKGSVKSESNKVLKIIELNKKIFKKLYPFKVKKGVKSFSYHLDNKKNIINQFSDNDVRDYLNDNIINGNILYIDYFEVRGGERDKGVGSKIIKDIIHTAKEIGLDGIYLDSYNESMEFWEKNGFIVDNDIQENLNGVVSNYHCSFVNLKENRINIEDLSASKINLSNIINDQNIQIEMEKKGLCILTD